MKKKYYIYIDIMRIFLFVSVLLYHLNILKGGYLAVCSFFVLSGYLSSINSLKNDNFSILNYYKKRFFQVYLPLLLVVLISISILSFFPNITWINIKSEVPATIFGFNNYWQLNMRLDYFATHIDSPLMHLWYVAILIQLELIFPFLFLILKKLGNKINKNVPIILTALTSVLSFIYFYINYKTNIMSAYYGTFSRCFSWVYGLFLGFIHFYYQDKLANKNINKIISFIFLIVLSCCFLFIDSSNSLLPISMVISTISTMVLINYAVSMILDKNNFLTKIVKYISSITYYGYLLQYPAIYLLLCINTTYNPLIIIVIVLVLSSILKFILSHRENFKTLRVLGQIILLIICSYGIYKYFKCEDYSLKIRQLEEELKINEQLMMKKQEEFENNQKEEKAKLDELLNDINSKEESLKDYVSNISLVGIGDSVMLGATPDLYKKFPKGYFDGKNSRTAYVLNGILKDLKSHNKLGSAILINLGSNGDCPISCKEEIMRTIDNREVFWVNTTNSNNINDNLVKFDKNYNNLHIIDWKTASTNHPEYFKIDGIHLTAEGRDVYANLVYNSIYDVYMKEYNIKKEEITEQQSELKNKITFYGNELLLYIYDELQSNYSSSNFVVNKDFDMTSLENEISKKELTNKIVLMFDNSMQLEKKSFRRIIELLNDKEIIIVSLNKDIHSYIDEDNNIKIIDFSLKIDKHPEYIMFDKIHLTKEGNLRLVEMLNSILNNE